VLLPDSRLTKDDWRAWVTTSTAALRISRGVGALAACGLAIAAAVVLATLALGRPIGSVGVLFIASFPVLAIGQLWGIAVLSARGSEGEDRRRRSGRWGLGVGAEFATGRRFFFEALPVRQANTLLVLAGLGWLAAAAAFPSLIHGGPASPIPDCRYPLVNHGSYRCVSHETYVHAGAAEQRFFAAIWGSFFAMHLGIAAAELARRRGGKSAPPDGL
jgi:hypothetical protein